MKSEGPLAPADRTMPALLAWAARRHAGRPLLTIGGADGTRTWTHEQAIDEAAATGAALRAAGVDRGDRVAILAGNRVEFLQAVLGASWIGAVAVPVNTAAMGPQIQYVLADSGARLLVIERALLARLDTADLRATALAAIRVLDGAGEADVPPAVQGIACAPWTPASDASNDGRIAPAPLRPGDPFAILYTSGTTGPAKGVICPHAQLYWWGVNSAQVLGVGPDDVLSTTLPLFHVNALNTVVQALVTGAQVAVTPRFSASAFWATVQAQRATVVYLLGAMVPILLAQPPGAAERAHRVRVALGPGVPRASALAFRERTGIALVEGYGSTETNFVICTGADEAPRGVMGRVRPGFAARVVDDDDHELPDGTAGELVLRADAPHAFASGYFGRAEQTVAAWRNLWFHTGDRVVREADGSFRFVDRLKDAIRRRGENISSWEVEQVLLGHPAVETVAAFPVTAELGEDEVMAALTLKPGASATCEELAAFCAPRLPYFAIPRYIDLVAELPRTENGKVQKFRLRERGITATTWDRTPGGAPARLQRSP